MSSIKKDTVAGVKWAAIERFSVQGIQFLLGLVMARLLSPSDYGTVGMLGLFLAVSQTFIDSGFSNALVRKKDRTEKDFVTVFYFNIAIAVVCYIILFFAAPWVGHFFNLPVLSPVLRVVAVNLVLNSLIGVHLAKLTIDINFKALAQRSLLAVVISGLLGIFLAYNGFGIWALVFQNLAGTVVNLLFIWLYCRWIPRGHFSKDSFRDLFSYGSKMLAAGLLHTLYDNLNQIVIGKFFSSKDLGVYSRGTQLARFPVDNINGVLQKVTFPVFAKINDDDERLVHVYRKYICITSAFIFFGCVLMAAISRPLVLFLLTDKWAEAIIYLQIFSFAIMFDHICSINLNLLQVKGRSDLFLRLEVIKKCISTAILFASIPFGVVGICVSKIIYTQIAVFINTYYTGKLFNMGYWKQMCDFMPYLLMALVSCVLPYILSRTVNNHIVVIILGCVSAVTVYLGLLYIKKDEVFMEFVVPQLKRAGRSLHR